MLEADEINEPAVEGPLCTTITPLNPVQLFGRGARSRPFDRIDSELEANLIALPGATGLVMIVAIDTLFAGDAFKAAMLEQLSPAVRGRVQDIVLVASHTHNAPALDPTKPQLGAVDADYARLASRRVAALVSRAAVGGQRPFSVGRGVSTCDLNASRRKRGLRILKQAPFVGLRYNGVPVHGPDVPRTLQLLVARNAQGAPVWAIWTWCCHATFAPDHQAVAADFPGHVRAYLREKLGAPSLPVVYLPGFCGDIRPDPPLLPVKLRTLAMQPLQRPFAMPTRSNYAKLCGALATALDQALRCTEPLKLAPVARLASTVVELGTILQGASAATTVSRMGITAIDVGDFGILLMGAETCSPYIAKLAGIVPASWLLSGYCDQVFGYLPDDRQIAEGGYEADEFFLSFGLTGRFAPKIEQSIVAAVRTCVTGARQRG